MPASRFVETLTPFFEGAPGFLYRLAAARPFGSLEQLFRRAREIAHAMPEALQVELVDAHPRLGAPPGSVSALSFIEQGYDRVAESGDMSDADFERERMRVATALEQLNDAYEARFGFRYCVFVAGRSRPVLIPAFTAALERERDAELHRALDAVVDIAGDRARKAPGRP
jgi:2-oxo-4-hydroxy-4-carboxy--5-ureidoimidazoline (OHCU) decarboxylase